MNFRLSIYILFISSFAFSQNDLAQKKYSDLIKSEDLKDNLSIIASDALEGRYTGTRGQKMAAAFIANHFRELGLKAPVQGSYFQPIGLYTAKAGDVYLVAGGNKYENFGEVYLSGNLDTGGEIKTDVVFIGQGRPEDLAQVDVKGKSVMLWTEKMNFAAS